MDAFLSHQRLVDDLLTDFADEHGIAPSELMRDLRDALEGSFTPLFEDHEYRWLADLLLSWNDYAAFCQAMAGEAAASESRRK